MVFAQKRISCQVINYPTHVSATWHLNRCGAMGPLPVLFFTKPNMVPCSKRTGLWFDSFARQSEELLGILMDQNQVWAWGIEFQVLFSLPTPPVVVLLVFLKLQLPRQRLSQLHRLDSDYPVLITTTPSSSAARLMIIRLIISLGKLVS